MGNIFNLCFSALELEGEVRPCSSGVNLPQDEFFLSFLLLVETRCLGADLFLRQFKESSVFALIDSEKNTSAKTERIA